LKNLFERKEKRFLQTGLEIQEKEERKARNNNGRRKSYADSNFLVHKVF
jgi:hypothetical protein